MKNTNHAYQLLNKKQVICLNKFKRSDLIGLVKSDLLKNKKNRLKLLDALQPFSDFFQKIIMLRYVFTETTHFINSAQEHLAEEFRHNISLETDRKHKPKKFYPLLESASAWFAWKMFTLNNMQKTVLVHWVLEASANIFFQLVHSKKYFTETDYFKTHSILDEEHQNIPENFFENLREEEIQSILQVLDEGWQVLMLATDEIAALTK
jgi:hypothetical protein